MNRLADVFKFAKLLHRFQQVLRKPLANGEDRHENDAEHSYQLAMTAWYLVDAHTLPLDRDKVIKYALIHDLVEAYAGDTYTYGSAQEREEKVRREHEAARQLAREFSEFGDMNALIAAYEARADEESRFVYALDKLIVPFNQYVDEGRSWKREGVTLEMVIETKKDKVALSPEVERYFQELVALLASEEAKLFRR